jgi:hypothetical protein
VPNTSTGYINLSALTIQHILIAPSGWSRLWRLFNQLIKEVKKQNCLGMDCPFWLADKIVAKLSHLLRGNREI